VAHPLIECGQENRIVRSRPHGKFIDDPSVAQVSQEQAGAWNDTAAVDGAVLGTSASADVAVKSSKSGVVRFAQLKAASISPIDEVFRRSDVSASDTCGVTHLGQGLGKTRKHCDCRTISHGENSLA